ncbi:hypothetical protein [Phyllobacterium sp. P5_D12]
MNPLPWMERIVRQFAIWLARRRPIPPEGIVNAGEGNAGYGCFQVELRDQDGNRFLPKKVAWSHTEGLWVSAGEPAYECSVRNSTLKDYDQKYLHFFRGYTITTRSAPLFILQRLSGYAYLARYWDLFAQRRFNKHNLVQQNRIRVLRLMLDETIKHDDFKVSPIGLVVELYSMRSIRHPESDSLINYYDLLLKSLVASGDLHQNQSLYQLAPPALMTLSAYEEEERRHDDNVWQQKLIGALTLVLIVVGIAQAVVTYAAIPTANSANASMTADQP